MKKCDVTPWRASVDADQSSNGFWIDLVTAGWLRDRQVPTAGRTAHPAGRSIQCSLGDACRKGRKGRKGVTAPA